MYVYIYMYKYIYTYTHMHSFFWYSSLLITDSSKAGSCRQTSMLAEPGVVYNGASGASPRNAPAEHQIALLASELNE